MGKAGLSPWPEPFPSCKQKAPLLHVMFHFNTNWKHLENWCNLYMGFNRGFLFFLSFIFWNIGGMWPTWLVYSSSKKNRGWESNRQTNPFSFGYLSTIIYQVACINHNILCKWRHWDNTTHEGIILWCEEENGRHYIFPNKFFSFLRGGLGKHIGTL